MTIGSSGPLAGRTVLVVGPGWLGGSIAHALQQANARVYAMQRTPPASQPTATVAESKREGETGVTPGAFGPPIVPVVGDITTAAADASVRAALPAHIDHLVLCIAPSRGRGDTHSSSYPSAARGAVALAVACNARSVLYTSSTGVYGRTAGELVDEDTVLHPTDARQQALVDAERILWDDAAAATPAAIVLRVAGLYGPGRDPGKRFGDPATVADGGEQWSNFSWRDDVSSAVLFLLADARYDTGAHCFNCTDGHPMQAKTIAGALGVSLAAPSVSSSARTLERAAEVAVLTNLHNTTSPEIGGAPAATPGSARARTSNQRVSIARLLAAGWSPAVPTVLDGLELLGHRVARSALTGADADMKA